MTCAGLPPALLITGAGFRSAMLRNIHASEQRYIRELQWSFPVSRSQYGLLQWYTGYGENHGVYSLPAFDVSGGLLASYDSGSDLIHILRSSDLTPIDRLKPTRWPRRLGFPPAGHFPVIETHQGWVDDHLQGKAAHSRVDIDSPEAVRDDIQRVEIWNLQTGQVIKDLSCDAVETVAPEGGWLWARRWAITPGYRSSALLEGHFPADETEFSILCWNGVVQRWDSRSWKRLGDIPPPTAKQALRRLSYTVRNSYDRSAPAHERIFGFTVPRTHAAGTRVRGPGASPH